MMIWKGTVKGGLMRNGRGRLAGRKSVRSSPTDRVIVTRPGYFVIEIRETAIARCLKVGRKRGNENLCPGRETGTETGLGTKIPGSGGMLRGYLRREMLLNRPQILIVSFAEPPEGAHTPALLQQGEVGAVQMHQMLAGCANKEGPTQIMFEDGVNPTPRIRNRRIRVEPRIEIGTKIGIRIAIEIEIETRIRIENATEIVPETGIETETAGQGGEDRTRFGELARTLPKSFLKMLFACILTSTTS